MRWWFCGVLLVGGIKSTVPLWSVFLPLVVSVCVSVAARRNPAPLSLSPSLLSSPHFSLSLPLSHIWCTQPHSHTASLSLHVHTHLSIRIEMACFSNRTPFILSVISLFPFLLDFRFPSSYFLFSYLSSLHFFSFFSVPLFLFFVSCEEEVCR